MRQLVEQAWSKKWSNKCRNDSSLHMAGPAEYAWISVRRAVDISLSACLVSMFCER